VTAAKITDPGRLHSDDDTLTAPDLDHARPTVASRPRGGALCHWLQAFEDAAKWRHARASAQCGYCDAAAPDRCDDHLLAKHQRRLNGLLAAVSDADPGTGS
jgi:hypothetical protein